MESFNSKVLLFGEYSVLHNSMALVMPCDRFSGQLNFINENTSHKYAYQSNEYLKKFSGFIASHIDQNFVLEVKQFEWEIENGLFFQSNIPQGYGLGSSAALVVAIFLRYLKKAKGFKDEFKEITFEKAQKLKTSLGQLESYFHGTSSGMDPLSVILNEPVLFKSSAEILPVKLPRMKSEGKNVIFLLDTGIARTTSEQMIKFNLLHQDLKFKNKIHDQLVNFTNESINSFLYEAPGNLYKKLDPLIQFQLEEMSPFIPGIFQKTVKQGLANGDYFLKLCGAGGGGYMLGFTENWEAAKEQLRDADLEIIYRY